MKHVQMSTAMVADLVGLGLREVHGNIMATLLLVPPQATFARLTMRRSFSS
jgi:hypothetical protein